LDCLQESELAFVTAALFLDIPLMLGDHITCNYLEILEKLEALLF